MKIPFLIALRSLLRKELLVMLKDKRARAMLILPIILQSLIFGYVATYDLNRIDYALLDEDRSYSSRALVRLFEGNGIFQRVLTIQNSNAIADTLDNKKALLVLHIAPNFERLLNSGQSAPVQVLVDGRNCNVAGTASSYAQSIIETFNAQRSNSTTGVGSSAVSARAWFNPNLETRWSFLSGMTVLLASVQVMLLSGLSVAREREQGTFDQLLVSPMGPATILAGKTLPAVAVGLFQSGLVFLIALLWFRIPFGGSALLFFFGLALFNFALVGLGLCISVLTSNIQQAMLYSFTCIMPMILLSGFLTPLSSMPEILQWLTLANPLRYGVDISRRVYLAGDGLAVIFPLLWPLFLIACIGIGTAIVLFRKKIC